MTQAPRLQGLIEDRTLESGLTDRLPRGDWGVESGGTPRGRHSTRKINLSRPAEGVSRMPRAGIMRVEGERPPRQETKVTASTARKTRPAVPTPAEAGVQVGDFFVSSWGYDQTNIDFYKVVALTPKGVKVQKWSSAVARDNGPQVYVVPGEGPATYTDWSATTPEMDYWERQEAKVEREVPVQTKRLSVYGSGESKSVYFSVNSYSSASKWDGKPEYQTGSGWGH